MSVQAVDLLIQGNQGQRIANSRFGRGGQRRMVPMHPELVRGFQHNTLVESTEQSEVLLELIHMFSIQVVRYRTRQWTTHLLSSGR